MKRLPIFLTLALTVWTTCLGEGFSTELEEEMLILVNRDRREHGLKPLLMDEELRRIARAHSEDMALNDFCAHESSDGRTLFDRIYQGGVWASSFAENVAKDTAVETAEEGLMNSPGHRENLLDSNYTHIGIGIFCATDGYIYVTQDFIRKIEKVEEEKAERELYERINSERERRGKKPLRVDPNLSILAWKNSLLMWEREKVKLLCPGLEGEYSGVVFGFLTDEVEDILKNERLFTTKGTGIGIGLLQKESREYGKGMLWVTIVIAK